MKQWWVNNRDWVWVFVIIGTVFMTAVMVAMSRM